jgi:hypothetical protein
MNPYDGGDAYLNPAIDVSQNQGDEKQSEAAAIETLIATQVNAMLSAEVQRAGRMAIDPAKHPKLKDFYKADRFESFAEPYLAAAVDVARAGRYPAARWRDVVQEHATASVTSWLSDAAARQAITGRAKAITSQIIGINHE